jgi:hypothetical protein
MDYLLTGRDRSTELGISLHLSLKGENLARRWCPADDFPSPKSVRTLQVCQFGASKFANQQYYIGCGNSDCGENPFNIIGTTGNKIGAKK